MVKKITSGGIINLYLNDYGKRYYLREISFLLGKPHQSVKPYVEKLAKENILIKYERKNLVEYGLNFENKKIYDYLVISEKEKTVGRLNEDVLFSLFYEKLSVFFGKASFLIFGSFVIESKKNSDIDLVVIGKINISKQIKEFEEIYNKKIHKVQVSNLEKLNLSLIKEIYKKHLILNNTECMIRFFGELYEKNKLV